MVEALEDITAKNQSETALDLGDKGIDELEKPQTSDLSYFIGTSHFDDKGL